MNKVLSSVFNKSAAHRTTNALAAAWLNFSVGFGLKPTMAIDKKIIFEWLEDKLKDHKITTIQALAFLSANVLVHPNSQGDEDDYIRRAIKLYNAPYNVLEGVREMCEADGIDAGSPKNLAMYQQFMSASGNNSSKVEAIKAARYVDDIVTGSKRRILGGKLFNREEITEDELNTLPQVSISAMKKRRKATKYLAAQTGKEQKDYAMLDIEEFYDILLDKRKRGHMTEAQVTLFLCFILHGLEARSGGESYIDHPMAVAGMVQKIGPKIFGGRPDLLKRATFSALLHDIGEHTNFKVDKHLKGLLEDDIAHDVGSLHRKGVRLPDGTFEYTEAYFEYVERIAHDPVTAVVKLCDIVHNTDGHEGTILKQNYVYRLAAEYLRASIERPWEVKDKSVGIWAVETGHCATVKDFELIEKIASKDKSDANGINCSLARTIDENFIQEIRLPQDADPRRDPRVPVYS